MKIVFNWRDAFTSCRQ